MADAKYFQSTQRGEIKELRQDLNSTNLEKKKDALKRIIAMMTTGRDVGVLIHDVIRNMQTPDLEMKKLVSLYLITYSKTDPDMVLHAVNTFLKDTKHPNPLIRALALRTMASIRVETLAEYLVEPLHRCLQDPDPYVKKTAVIGVGKLFDVSAELVLDEQFIDELKNLLSDSNPMVVSNTVATLREIQDASPDRDVFRVNEADLGKMLDALNTCNEWGQVFILDAMATFRPADSETAERIIERVLPRLNHANSAVVLSSVKIIMLYMDIITNDDLRQTLLRKLGPPLVTQLSAAPEIRYVALRNINLIIQKYPHILQADIKVFFCKYNDPLYVKMEKLELMMLLVSEQNIQSVLSELKEYASEVDVDFVRKSVRAIGRCAIRLEAASDLCVEGLVQLIDKSQVNYVIQEAIVVIRDIFRKYPNRYERIISRLCEKLENLDEPEAKAAMIWILGEYSDRIEGADEVLAPFIDSFHDEPASVQLTLLSAVVKLYLKGPGNTQALVHRVLRMATQESDNPDLRDRGFVYWRLLSASINAAREVVLAEKPPISGESNLLSPELLNELLPHMATLGSVFHKPPEAFLSRSKLAVPHGESLTSAPEDEEEPSGASPQTTITTTTATTPQQTSGEDLIPDFLGGTFNVAPTPTATQTTDAPAPAPTRLGPKQPRVIMTAEQGHGLMVTGDFIIEDGTIFLDATFYNQSTEHLSDFEIQFNRNSFGICPAATLDLPAMRPGQSCPTRLPCVQTDQHVSTDAPFSTIIQMGLRSNTGLVFFEVPVPVLCATRPGATIEKTDFAERWQQIPDTQEVTIDVAGIPGLEPTVQRLQGANLAEIARRRPQDNPDVVVLYFYGQTSLFESEFFVEFTLKPPNNCTIAVRATRQEIAQPLLNDIASYLA